MAKKKRRRNRQGDEECEEMGLFYINDYFQLLPSSFFSYYAP